MSRTIKARSLGTPAARWAWFSYYGYYDTTWMVKEFAESKLWPMIEAAPFYTSVSVRRQITWTGSGGLPANTDQTQTWLRASAPGIDGHGEGPPSGPIYPLRPLAFPGQVNGEAVQNMDLSFFTQEIPNVTYNNFNVLGLPPTHATFGVSPAAISRRLFIDSGNRRVTYEKVFFDPRRQGLQFGHDPFESSLYGLPGLYPPVFVPDRDVFKHQIETEGSAFDAAPPEGFIGDRPAATPGMWIYDNFAAVCGSGFITFYDLSGRNNAQWRDLRGTYVFPTVEAPNGGGAIGTYNYTVTIA